MIRADSLQLIGKPLFAEGRLVPHLEAEVRKQVVAEYLATIAKIRKGSQLQLRRRFDRAVFSGAVSISPGAAIVVDPERGKDGRHSAQLVCAITGDPAFLSYAPVHAMPERRPIATIKGNELVITVCFLGADWPFVSPLVRSELQLIQEALARQREVVIRFNEAMPDLVRRLVAQEWARLTGQSLRH